MTNPEDTALSVMWRSTLDEVGENLRAEDVGLRQAARSVWDYYDQFESTRDLDYEVAAPLWNAYYDARDRATDREASMDEGDAPSSN
jgi:hypothetical protein